MFTVRFNSQSLTRLVNFYKDFYPQFKGTANFFDLILIHYPYQLYGFCSEETSEMFPQKRQTTRMGYTGENEGHRDVFREFR